MPEVKNDELIWCAFCKGHGRIGINKEKICPTCDGVGKFLAPNKWIWCSVCKGSGVDPLSYNTEQQKQQCPTCGGKGRVRPSTL